MGYIIEPFGVVRHKQAGRRVTFRGWWDHMAERYHSRRERDLRVQPKPLCFSHLSTRESKSYRELGLTQYFIAMMSDVMEGSLTSVSPPPRAFYIRTEYFV